MKIKLEINLLDTEQVNAALTLLSSYTPAEKKTGRAAKAAQEQTADNTPPERPVEEAKKEITIEDIAELVASKVSTHRMEMKEELARLGVQRVSGLKPERYQDFANFIKSL